jgi:PAS domain S-box-containing protein
MNYVIVSTNEKAISHAIRIVLKEKYVVEEVPYTLLCETIVARRPGAVIFDADDHGELTPERLLSLFSIDPSLTVILLADRLNNTMEKALETGAFEIIEKPFQSLRILHTVKRAIVHDTFSRQKDSPHSTPFSETSLSITSRDTTTFFEELSQTIASCMDSPEHLLSETFLLLRKYRHTAKTAFFLRKNSQFIPIASLGIDDKFLSEILVPSTHPLIEWFSRKTCMVAVENPDMNPAIRSLLEMCNVQCAFPCISFNGTLIGFLLTGGPVTGRALVEQDISFFTSFSDFLTTAIENIGLQQEIIAQKNYQEAIVTNVPSGIIGVNEEGKIIVCNESAHTIFGIDQSEGIGSPIERLGAPVADVIRQTLDSQEPIVRKELLLSPEKIIIGISTNPIVSEGILQGAVAIFQDLSAIKVLEAKEREVERNGYLNSLASRLSHELKNPLVAIKTFSQLLPEKFDDQEFRTSFAKIVQDEIATINMIIENISKLAETRSFHTSEFDLVDFLHTLRGTYETDTRTPNVSFQIEKQSSFPIAGDPLRINEAIGHLISFFQEEENNAFVTIKANTEESSFLLEVSGNCHKNRTNDNLLSSFAPELKQTASIGVILAKKIFEAHHADFSVTQNQNKTSFLTRIPRSSHGKNINR